MSHHQKVKLTHHKMKYHLTNIIIILQIKLKSLTHKILMEHYHKNKITIPKQKRYIKVDFNTKKVSNLIHNKVLEIKKKHFQISN